MPATNKFLDTFTDADGTLLTAHAPDSQVGIPYTFASTGVEIRGNKAQYSHAAITSGRIAISGADVALAVGDDVWSDITFATTVAGSSSVLEAALLIHQSAVAFEEYAVRARYSDATGQISIGADDDGITWGAGIIGTASAPSGQIRLGATIVSATELNVWVEPYGGGTRSQIGTFTAANDYSANNRIGFGMYVEAPSGETLTVSHENFTAETPSNKCFDTTYTCQSADAPSVTQVTEPSVPAATQIEPAKRIEVDSSCIAAGTLVDY